MKNIIRISGVILITLSIILIHSCKKEEIPTLTTADITNITGTSASSGGTINDEGSGTIIARGVCWSTNILPSIADNKTTDGAGAGSFTSNMSGLNGGTVYYARAYATNNNGTGYGMVMSFKTTGEPPKAPSATTQPATTVTTTAATLNGKVNANDLSATVTFEYGKSISYGSSAIAIQSPVTGNSSANVSAEITGLLPGTTYHFRVKAENDLGTTTGNNLTFKVLEPPGTSGIDTINNIIYVSNTYFVYGFSFSLAGKISTNGNPKPDITVYVNFDNLPYRLTFQANNLKPSFYKVGDFADLAGAISAFNNLKTVTVSQWKDMADPINANQVWIYRSESERYAKIRIISTVNENRQGIAYGECTFQWVFQPDNSLTFPSK